MRIIPLSIVPSCKTIARIEPKIGPMHGVQPNANASPKTYVGKKPPFKFFNSRRISLPNPNFKIPTKFNPNQMTAPQKRTQLAEKMRFYRSLKDSRNKIQDSEFMI